MLKSKKLEHIGFLVNIREGSPPTRDFTLFRIAAMDEILRGLGAQLFVFSPRQVDPDSGQVSGLIVEEGRFVTTTAPVPAVNGSWYIGRDKSTRPSMDARQFKKWVTDRDIDIYPLPAFSNVLKDKFKTSRMIRDLNPALHPLTEIYDGSLEQLTRFVQRYRSVFVKPRFGSKGNDIFSIRHAKPGLHCAYYSARQMQEITLATATDALALMNQAIGKGRFVIQQGVAIDRYQDAPFIFRVIMLDDGERWQWVHKAVLAAPGSEIANTTQGGSNWKIVDLLEALYGANKSRDLFEELQRVSFDIIAQLDKLFPGKLMEVAFDFVLSKKQQLKILEINTLPGMTKPGLPPQPAFVDILNRRPSERMAYETLVLPHGSCLARFLFTRLKQRRARLVPAAPGPAAGYAPKAGKAGFDSNGQDDDMPVDPDLPLLDQVISRQVAHLVRSCLADGSLRRRVHPGGKTIPDPRYDTLRHIEVIDVLGRFNQWRPGAGVREAVLRAGNFFKAHFIAPVPGEEQLLAVWSRSEFNLLGKPDQARLGWAALGLVALLNLERQNPGFTHLKELRALGDFLRWGQSADGRFRCLYVPGQGGWKQGWKSLNYPGEAIFALTLLHQLEPRPGWIHAAIDGMAQLVRARQESGEYAADYWALLATDQILPLFDEAKTGISRERLIHHARQICKTILAEQKQNSSNPSLAGGFDLMGRTEPTAARLQGLLAASRFMGQEDPAFDDLLRRATRDGIEFLVRACTAGGLNIEVMPRMIRPLSVESGGASPVYNPRSARAGLGNVAQALTAMIQYVQLTPAAIPTPGDQAARNEL